MPLDNRTLMVMAAAIAFSMSIVAALAWRTQPGHRICARWAVANGIMALTFFLLGMDGIWPTGLVVGIANVTAIVAAIVYLEGVREFCGLAPRRGLLWLAGMDVAAFACYLRFVEDRQALRIFLVSSFVGALFLACAALISFRLPSGRGFGSRLTAIVFAVYGLANLARGIIWLADPRPQSFLAPTAFNTASFVVNVFAVLGWTVGLLLMTGDRVAHDLEHAQRRILRGILIVCASCKKIRDESGAWQPMESYISSRSEVEFSHGWCPECGKKAQDDLRRRHGLESA